MQATNGTAELLTDTLQRERTEAAMLRNFGLHLGTRLSPKSLPLPSGGHMEIDGFSTSPAVLCQVRSEIGPLTQEQEQSTIFDILKLSYAANVLGNTARRVLLFRDKATARQICSRPEVAEELGDFGIEVCAVDC